jgi:hypothetical protein
VCPPYRVRKARASRETPSFRVFVAHAHGRFWPEAETAFAVGDVRSWE